jgi:hypothetical protein
MVPRTGLKIAAAPTVQPPRRRSTGRHFVFRAVDNARTRRLYNLSDAPPMLRRDGASAKPLTVSTVNAHPAMSRWSCRMCGFRRLRLLPETEPQGSGMFDK